jgi:RNA polymerase sigma-70 factor (ECF subfamily)
VRLDLHEQTIRRFALACRLGDSTALAAVLDVDVVARCDGGGRAPAPNGPVHGADDVARLVMTLLGGRGGGELTVESVNGRAGLTLRRASRAVAVVGAETAGSTVTTLWIVLNPVKLRGWHRG